MGFPPGRNGSAGRYQRLLCSTRAPQAPDGACWLRCSARSVRNPGRPCQEITRGGATRAEGRGSPARLIRYAPNHSTASRSSLRVASRSCSARGVVRCLGKVPSGFGCTAMALAGPCFPSHAASTTLRTSSSSAAIPRPARSSQRVPLLLAASLAVPCQLSVGGR